MKSIFKTNLKQTLFKISRLYAKYNGNKLDEPQIWKDAYKEDVSLFKF